MKHFHFFYVVLGVMIAQVSLLHAQTQQSCGPNLIVNSSFDGPKGENTVAPGWTAMNLTPDVNDTAGALQSSPGCNWVTPPLPSPNGGTWQNLFSNERVGQKVAVIPGAPYRLSFFYCIQEITDGIGLIYNMPVAPYLYITGGGGSGMLSTPSGINAWQHITMGFGAQSDTLEISFAAGHNSYLAIDSVTLELDSFVLEYSIAGVCDSGETILTPYISSEGPTYQWSTGDSTKSIMVPPGVYTVTATLGHCKAIKTAQVVQSGPPNAVVNPANPMLCPYDSVKLCASGSKGYIWNTGSTSLCIFATTTGAYWVTATNAYGCTAESNHVVVGAYPSQQINTGVIGDTLFIYNSGGIQWYLDGIPIPGATQPSYVMQQQGLYVASYVDTNGCRVYSNPIAFSSIGSMRDDMKVEVFPNPGSGYFKISIKEEGDFKIYNNAGQLVRAYYRLAAGSILDIDISNQPAGVYTVNYITASGSGSTQLIKY